MSAENGGLDALLAGVSKMLEENPELGRLAASVPDLSSLTSLLDGTGTGSEASDDAAGAAAEPAGVPPQTGAAAENAAALLAALRPFLCSESACRVDRALRILTAAKHVRAVMRTVGAWNQTS